MLGYSLIAREEENGGGDEKKFLNCFFYPSTKVDSARAMLCSFFLGKTAAVKLQYSVWLIRGS